MSEQYKVTLPKLGESILNATVVQWFKKVGERVERDEPLLEVSTDKVNSEIPSPVAGVLEKICAEVEQDIEVGALLAIVRTGDAAIVTEAQAIPAAKEEEAGSEDKSTFFSPVVLRLAGEFGISIDELKKIPATGVGGRVSKKDLEAYMEKRASKPTCKHEAPSSSVERVKMTGMRKAIADNMVRSFYEAPHASLITEVDVTDILAIVQKEKEAFFLKHGAKLTITSFIARAITKALKSYPLLNSSLDGDTIVVKHFVNLGIAVSVSGGLMVPVVKHCEGKSLTELAIKIHELSQKAREGNLSVNDVQEGSISLTNFGMTGILMGVPIIRYPEVAIIGVGAVHKKVTVLEDDLFGVRSMVHLSLTFDHRILDGIYGCEFLSLLKKNLESDLFID